MMKIKFFLYRNLFDIFIGLFVIVVLGIIISTSSIIIGLSETQFAWLPKVLSFILLVIGGYVTGWRVKEKGIFFGGLLGCILVIFSIGLASITFLLPDSFVVGSAYPPNYGYDLAQKNILNQLINAPVTIILTSLGGLLGEKYFKKQQKNRKL